MRCFLCVYCLVVAYEVGVHQVTVELNGTQLFCHKQNLLQLLFSERHDRSCYVGVSSGVTAHLQLSTDSKQAPALPATTPLQRWVMDGGKTFAPLDKALFQPDSEAQWLALALVQLKELEKWMRGGHHSHGMWCGE